MKFSSIVFALSLVAAPAAEAVKIVKGSSIERILSGKNDGKGKSSGKSGGSTDAPANPCDLCKDGRPDSLTFKYLPNDPRAHAFEKHTCGLYGSFPSSTTLTVKDKDGTDLGTGSIFDGAEFTINGPFDADSFFHFAGFSGLDNGGDSCIIHTSCSDELLPGYENRIGPFELIGPECGAPTDPCAEDCLICDTNNKIRPDILTLQYLSAGQTSMYQPFDKATCVAGTYPSSTSLTVKDKNGNVQEVISGVTDGQIFSIGSGYDLEAETHFSFDGAADCFIHTSCSVPLVANDVIGPFRVLEGNTCKICSEPPTEPPTMPPTGPPTMPPTGPPTMPPTGPPTEPPTMPPTGSPTEPPTVPPTPPPTPEPCLQVDQLVYNCADPIGVTWNVPDDAYLAIPDNDSGELALRSDWIGIYPCANLKFFHAEVWKWTCDEPMFTSDTCEAVSAGSMTFDSLPVNNEAGPHTWPVAPYVIASSSTGEINTCFKAVLLRNDGPSVPPYVPICESGPFTINAVEGLAGCAVRQDGSPSQALSHNLE